MPENATDTFTHPCLSCGETIHVIGGATQPHDCEPPPTMHDAIAKAYWAGHAARAEVLAWPGGGDHEGHTVIPTDAWEPQLHLKNGEHYMTCGRVRCSCGQEWNVGGWPVGHADGLWLPSGAGEAQGVLPK